MLLRTQSRVRHGGHHLDRKVSNCGFRGEHDGICAIQHGIGDIKYFCAGGHGVTDHGFHHLRGRNHHAVTLSRGGNQIFLNTNELGVTHLDTQITARHHHAVGRVNDAIKQFRIGDHFGTLDFRDDRRAKALI